MRTFSRGIFIALYEALETSIIKRIGSQFSYTLHTPMPHARAHALLPVLNQMNILARSIRNSIAYFLFLISCTQLIADVDIYVSTSGTTTGTGTLESPFNNLPDAKAYVRGILPSTSEPVNVWLEGGTYYLDEPLHFDSSDSGGELQTVTYSALPDEQVILSGGAQLTPVWSDHTALIKVANIGTGHQFDMFFVNNEAQDMARFPNRTDEDAPFDGAATEDEINARVSLWQNPSTGFYRGLHSAKWGGNSYTIDGVDSSGALLTTWVGDNNRGSSMHPDYRMVENIFEELDYPGEWFYDSSDGLLYYYPKDGIDLDSATFQVSRIEEIIRISDTEDSVKHITFNQLQFKHTNRTLFTGTYELLNRSDWAVVRSGAVYIENAENITVQECTFEELGGNAIFLSNYNQNHLIEGNSFLSVGATCVNVAGSKNSLWAPNQWDDAITEASQISADEIGPKTDEYPKSINIANNYMYNMGRFEKQTSGVNLFICEEITVKGNTIHRCPRAGVNICDGSWGGHIIEYNDIYDCVRETHDHGPINVWGRDRFWTIDGPGNTGENGSSKRPYALYDAYKTTHIRNNRVHYDEPNSFGIDLDDGATNYWVYNNLCLNTDIKLREGFDRKCFNNIIINRGIAMHVWFDECNDEIYNNIIVYSAPYGPYQTGVSTENGRTNLNNFYNNGEDVSISSFDWEESDQDSIIADPLFNNPLLLDYSVSDDSPALGLGFVNFSMNEFGLPDAPKPQPIDFSTGTNESSQIEPLMGANISPITDTGIQSVLGAPDLNGVYFQEVSNGSYASIMGIKTLDCIRAVNGVSLTDSNSFWNLYLQIPPREMMTLTLLRNQVELELDVQRPIQTEFLNGTSGISYSGSWSTQDNEDSYYGDLLYTNTVDDYCEFTFYGTGFSITSQRNNDMGLVEVYIDDVLEETINLYAAERAHQQIIFEASDLELASHTVKLVNKESKYFIIDAYAVTPLRDIDNVVALTATYTNTAPSVDNEDLAQTSLFSTSGSGTGLANNHHKLVNGLTGNADGAINEDSEVILYVGDSLRVDFDTSTNIAGYDITEIYSLFGWNPGAGGRSNQGYSITFHYTNGTSETISPRHWAPNDTPTYWTSVSITEESGYTLAENVSAIAIQIDNEANAKGFVVAREFDFIGSPSKYTYDYWAKSNNVTLVNAPEEDFDQDGISNFFEFYYGCDPYTPNSSPISIETENNVPYLQFESSLATADNPLTIDVSYDLESWSVYDQTSTADSIITTPISNAKRRVKISLPSASPNHRTFWRLKSLTE